MWKIKLKKKKNRNRLRYREQTTGYGEVPVGKTENEGTKEAQTTLHKRNNLQGNIV